MDVCTLIIKKKSVCSDCLVIMDTVRICIHAKTLFLKVFIPPMTDDVIRSLTCVICRHLVVCFLFCCFHPHCTCTISVYSCSVFWEPDVLHHWGERKKKESGTAATLGSSRRKHKMHFQCVQTVTSIYSCSRVDCTSRAA